jgi:hypothetical protein
MTAVPAPTPDAPQGPAAYLWCSDCRAPLRQTYYALNERPICAKCRPNYARRIERAEGKGAMLRVGLQGALIALAGIVVLTIVISVFPPARIFFLIPIGYLTGKQIMKALDGYSSRRYQYLSVGLTYACFLIGFTIPAAMEQDSARERHAANRAKVQGTMATQTDALKEELAAPNPLAIDAPEAETPAAAAPAEEANIGPGPGLAVAMFLFFPFIAMLQFGMAFSAVGVASLGYALYQAWTQTDGQGMHLALSGPFRVGQGPIAAH